MERLRQLEWTVSPAPHRCHGVSTAAASRTAVGKPNLAAGPDSCIKPLSTAHPHSHPQQLAGARRPASPWPGGRGSRRLSASSAKSEELPTLQTLLERARQRRLRAAADTCQPDHLCGLEEREWAVDRILDRRTAGRLVQYKMKWKDSQLAARHIRTRPDGSKHVVCLDRDWSILHLNDVADDVGPEEARITDVAWEDSWCDEADLGNARNLVDAFNAARDGGVDGISRRAFSRMRDHVGHLGGRLLPRHNINYGPALRATVVAEGGKKSETLRKLLRARPILHTVFHANFVDGGRLVNVERPSKRNAMLAHDSGQKQARPCERCARGDGPFAQCVAGLNSVGSCTGCLFDERGPDCNFHNTRTSILSAKLKILGRTLIWPADERHFEADRSKLHHHGHGQETRMASPSSPPESTSAIASPAVEPSSPHSEYTEPTSPMNDEPSCEPFASSPLLHRDSGNQARAPARHRGALSLSISSPASSVRPCAHARAATPTSRKRPVDSRWQQHANSAALGAKRRRRPSCSIGEGQNRNAVVDRPSSPPSPDDAHLDVDRGSLSDEPWSPGTSFSTAHANCAGGMEPCTAYTYTSAAPPIGSSSSSRLLGTLYDDAVFDKGGATPAQVRFVLSRLSCENAELFEEHWRAWRRYCGQRGRVVEETREQYLSETLWRELNAMVVFCPRRPGSVVYRPGLRREEPVVIEDSD